MSAFVGGPPPAGAPPSRGLPPPPGGPAWPGGPPPPLPPPRPPPIPPSPFPSPFPLPVVGGSRPAQLSTSRVPHSPSASQSCPGSARSHDGSRQSDVRASGHTEEPSLSAVRHTPQLEPASHTSVSQPGRGLSGGDGGACGVVISQATLTYTERPPLVDHDEPEPQLFAFWSVSHSPSPSHIRPTPTPLQREARADSAGLPLFSLRLNGHCEELTSMRQAPHA